MATTGIIFGSARTAHALLPNQVSTQDFGTTSAFKDPGSCHIVRAKDPQLAAKLARLMQQACNNDLIGYVFGSKKIFDDHINSRVRTSADCSSLVIECVREASGSHVNYYTTAGIVEGLVATGMFQSIKYSSPVQLYNGDIVNRRISGSGHVGIIVRGAKSRDGSAYSDSDDIIIADYFEWNPEAETAQGIPKSYAGFTPRTTAPVLAPPPEPIYSVDKKGRKTLIGYTEDVRDLWYVSTDDEYPGYNPFKTVDEESYIWCRFSEIMNSACALGKGALGSIYSHKEDGYQRNVAASLGAVMCFTKPKTRGWAAIVEGIDPNGSVVLSYYGQDGNFKMQTLTKRYGVWDFNGYKFVGFVHNPGVSLLGVAESAKETFIRIAEEQIGSDSSWTFSQVEVSDNNGWSAAFVTACSATAGSSLNIIIPNVTSCSAIGRVGVLRNMGQWYEGPAQNSFTNPEPGDIVLFRKSINKKGMSTYDADHAGIVTEVNGATFKVVEGDYSDSVQRNEYSISCKQISGYFRPKWDIIDGTSDSVNQYRDLQGLYTEGVTINDAAVREVGYLNSNFKPSISSSKLKLSAINYTGLLGNMYSVFAQTTVSDAAKSELVVDLWTNTIKSYYQTDGVEFESTADGLMEMFENNISAISSSNEVSTTDEELPAANIDIDANRRATYRFFIQNGVSPAAACGIMGNIEAESRFNTAAIGDHGTSFGICQWHAGRGTNMKTKVGNNWKNDLTGQLNFLMDELRNYPAVQSAIVNSPNTKIGARTVADVFVRKFERPANVDAESLTRQANASKFWTELVN